MRSQRRYQQAFPTERILEVLKRSDGKQFDQHLVRRFVQLIGIYPAGNMVRLNTGEVGVVANVYAPDPYRPHVRVLFDREGRRLARALRVEPVGGRRRRERPVVDRRAGRSGRLRHRPAAADVDLPADVAADPLRARWRSSSSPRAHAGAQPAPPDLILHHANIYTAADARAARLRARDSRQPPRRGRRRGGRPGAEGAGDAGRGPRGADGRARPHRRARPLHESRRQPRSASTSAA